MRVKTTLADEMSAREMIARALFMTHRPAHRWDGLHEPSRKLWYFKADKILKSTGYENAKLIKGELPLVALDKED